VTPSLTEREMTSDGLAVFDYDTRKGEVGGDVAYLWCTHAG